MRVISHFFLCNEVIDELLCVCKFMCVVDDVRGWIGVWLVWLGQRQHGVIKHTHRHTHLSFGCSVAPPSYTGNIFCRRHGHRGDGLRGGGLTEVGGDKGHVTERETYTLMRPPHTQTEIKWRFKPMKKYNKEHELMLLNWVSLKSFRHSRIFEQLRTPLQGACCTTIGSHWSPGTWQPNQRPQDPKEDLQSIRKVG